MHIFFTFISLNTKPNQSIDLYNASIFYFLFKEFIDFLILFLKEINKVIL